MKLTEKQLKFADYFLEMGNATEAAIKAGYSEKYAGTNTDKLLKNTNVKEYIEERKKQLDTERIANQEEVLEYLTAVMRGNEKDQFGLDAALADRTKAAELLGKRYRLFTDKVEHSGSVEGVVIVNDIPKPDAD
ncbi:terminase small subunit [uncultured Robinsoniella sp.]|jgi:phage terminase small subunit|uniref:terminase small subunit n=1 Tax=uncultured Robinsoniella sp. TaxID=904190 RepID=UPI0020583F35|nr:MAG TPA: Terminase small subunit [Caudoviricetes sp.]